MPKAELLKRKYQVLYCLVSSYLLTGSTNLIKRNNDLPEKNNTLDVPYSEAYEKSNQTSRMELFSKIVNGF